MKVKPPSFLLGLLASLALVTVAGAVPAVGQQSVPTAPGSTSQLGATRIARWKDDKSAAFCLMFDDSIPSDIATVLPELKKHNMVGTFYVNPGGSGWKRNPRAWEKELPASPFLVYANHTMTHAGARSVEQLNTELKQCNDVIYKLVPGKQPRLLSFGRPGVKKEDWTVTEAELQTALTQNHLVERPPFGGHGAMIAFTTAEQMAKLADSAIAKQTMECIVFHGVGGDWIVTPTATFVQFLDLLSARRDKLWITDHLSAYQYEKERDSAEVRVLSATPKQIQLQVGAKTDPLLFDTPLTVVTRVPAAWGECEVLQKGLTTKHTPQAGMLQFDVIPGESALTIRPLKANR